MSRLGRTLFNLFLACLNATLILVAVCLFLGLRLNSEVEDVAEHFSAGMLRLDAVGSEVAALREEVALLREDLAQGWDEAEAAADVARQQLGGVSLETLQDTPLEAERAEALAELGARVERLTEAVEQAAGAARQLATDPTPLAEAVAGAVVGELSATVDRIRACGEPAA
ncbi:MAG: hypothetical protein AAFX00_00500 [Pseudomonadota bacterium]